MPKLVFKMLKLAFKFYEMDLWTLFKPKPAEPNPIQVNQTQLQIIETGLNQPCKLLICSSFFQIIWFSVKSKVKYDTDRIE